MKLNLVVPKFAFPDLSVERSLVLLILLTILMVGTTLVWISWIRIDSQKQQQIADKHFRANTLLSLRISDQLGKLVIMGQALKTSLNDKIRTRNYLKELADMRYSISQDLASLQSKETGFKGQDPHNHLLIKLDSHLQRVTLLSNTYTDNLSVFPELMNALEQAQIAAIQNHRLELMHYDETLYLITQVEIKRYQYFFIYFITFMLIGGYLSVVLFRKISKIVAGRVKSEAELRSLLNSTAQAIYGIDRWGNCTFCNTTCVEMLGFESSDALLGKNMYQLIHHSREDGTPLPESECRILQFTHLSDSIHEPKDIFWKADNTSIPVEYWAYPIHDHSGAIQGKVIAFFDITEKLGIEKQLNKYQSELETMVREQTEELNDTHAELVRVSHRAGMSEIASGVLHNVGNVLNSINIGTDVSISLADRLLPNRLNKAVELLKNSTSPPGEPGLSKDLSDYLNRVILKMDKDKGKLIDELHAMSKHVDHVKNIIATQQKYATHTYGKREAIDISTLISDSLSINTDLIKKHGIEVNLNYEGDTVIRTEQHKILQILINLISNAAYALASEEATDASEKTPGITISTRSTSSGIILEVRDNGPGIREENLNRIFNQGVTTRTEGHGLGLHISAILAQELGGELIAENNAGSPGATFRLSLPHRQEYTESFTQNL